MNLWFPAIHGENQCRIASSLTILVMTLRNLFCHCR